MKTYVFNRFYNTVTRITVEAESEEEAGDKVFMGEGCEGKEEVLESWEELDKEETERANRRQ